LAFPSSWIPVEPNKNAPAILGPLPFRQGSVTYTIPATVVPPTASGILVFVWAALSGKNGAQPSSAAAMPTVAYWHIVSETASGRRDFFSLLVAGDPSGASVMCNSQAFWLPMPTDAKLIVTLHAADLPSPTNRGEVEIHGYAPGPSPA
jgi:hypothetical protein